MYHALQPLEAADHDFELLAERQLLGGGHLEREAGALAQQLEQRDAVEPRQVTATGDTEVLTER